MVVHAAGVALIMEGVVVHAVGEALGVEAVLAVVELAVLDVGLVVLLLIHLLAPSVVDAELVGEDGVHVHDGEHVVDAVTVGRHHVGELEVGLDIDGVGDGAGASLVGLDREGDHELAPCVVGVEAVDVVGLVTAVAVVPCPGDHVGGSEDGDVGNVDEGDLAALAEVGSLRVGEEVGDGLGIYGEVVGLEDGVGAAVLGADDEQHAIYAAVLHGEGGVGAVGGEHDLVALVDDGPVVVEGDLRVVLTVGIGGEVGEGGVEGRAALHAAGAEVGDGLRVEDDLRGIAIGADQ